MAYFTNSPDEAESSFYAAFGNLDLDLMRATWHFSDEIFCIHPGGPAQTGLDTILNHWAYVFKDANPPEINYRVLNATRQDGIAVHLVEETIGTGSQAAIVLATNLYILTAEGWRLFGHHASLPPEQAVVPSSAIGPMH